MGTSDLNPTVQPMVGLARRWELFFRKADENEAAGAADASRRLCLWMRSD